MPDGFSGARLAPDTILAEVLGGLCSPRKTLPAKLFYDDEGCRLFERITQLPEYYPTRTETALLRRIAPDIRQAVPPGAALVEYGASTETKARLLLDGGAFAAYVPIDVAGNALSALSGRLRAPHPDLAVHPLTADFLGALALPDAVATMPRLGFFPGSTIGNLDADAARGFLGRARQDLGDGALFLVGVDLRKDPAILLPAYDDAQGVTAAFNLNLLTRLNRELGTDFDRPAFAHRALWNEAESRIEMHLVSLRPQAVRLADRTIHFAAGETIHTENSHKYTLDGFRTLAEASGWRPRHCWTDPEALFSIHLLAADQPRSGVAA